MAKFAVIGAATNNGFTDLHTENYRRIIKREGFKMESAIPALESDYTKKDIKQLVAEKYNLQHRKQLISAGGLKNPITPHCFI